MRVLAIKRQASAKPAFVDELWDVSGLDRLLGESDHVVNCLPGTVHTRHLLDARRIGLMKRAHASTTSAAAARSTKPPCSTP